MISRLQAVRAQLSPFVDELTKLGMTTSMAEIHERLYEAQRLQQHAVFKHVEETMEQ